MFGMALRRSPKHGASRPQPAKCRALLTTSVPALRLDVFGDDHSGRTSRATVEHRQSLIEGSFRDQMTGFRAPLPCAGIGEEVRDR